MTRCQTAKRSPAGVVEPAHQYAASGCVFSEARYVNADVPTAMPDGSAPIVKRCVSNKRSNNAGALPPSDNRSNTGAPVFVRPYVADAEMGLGRNPNTFTPADATNRRKSVWKELPLVKL